MPSLKLSTITSLPKAEYGPARGEANMMAEIFARGPIACGIDASKILDYQGMGTPLILMFSHTKKKKKNLAG